MWTGWITPYGYGETTLAGHKERAHRAVWMIANGGEVPRGMHVHHTCGVKSCVSPAHLCVLTPAEHAAEHLDEVRRSALVAASKVAAAKNRAKTHCKHGHEFTDENTYVRKEGNRMCRACMHERYLKRRGITE